MVVVGGWVCHTSGGGEEKEENQEVGKGSGPNGGFVVLVWRLYKSCFSIVD